MNTLGVEGPSTTAPGGKPDVDGLSVPFYLSALKNNPDSEKVEHMMVFCNKGLEGYFCYKK